MSFKLGLGPHESLTFEGVEQVPDAGEHCTLPSACQARAAELKHS